MRTYSDLISLFQKKSAQIPQFIGAKLSDHGLGGLSPSHGEILYYLLREGDIKMSVLAKRIHKDKSTVTALVNKLMQQGYVVREKCPNDQRAVLVKLTDKGTALQTVFQAISKELMAQFYAPFSKKELYTMHELVSKINVDTVVSVDLE